MRLLGLELKRIVKTKSTWILLLIIILLSGIMAYFPISYVSAYQVDTQGNVIELKGREAIDYLKKSGKEIEGEMTEERIEQAIVIMQEVVAQYGGVFPPEVPMEIYAEKIEPIHPLLKAITYVLAPEGVALETISVDDIVPEDANVFYEAYKEGMISLGKSEAEQQRIMELNGKVEMPFVYYPSYSSESLDYLVLYLLLMMLAFAMVVAPLFSAEYQTGADSILRCTKCGRIRLAVTKIIAAVVIFFAVYAVSMSVFLMVTNLTFGMEGLKTSVQLLNYIFVIPAITIGQTQMITVLAGLITLLAVISCTLFLSAWCKNVQTSLMASLLLCILPIIIYMMSSENLADMIRSILPAGGIGMMNTFLYELLGRNFVQIGPKLIWIPHLMLAAELIEIPVFLGLTVRKYCRREAV